MVEHIQIDTLLSRSAPILAINIIMPLYVLRTELIKTLIHTACLRPAIDKNIIETAYTLETDFEMVHDYIIQVGSGHPCRSAPLNPQMMTPSACRRFCEPCETVC